MSRAAVGLVALGAALLGCVGCSVGLAPLPADEAATPLAIAGPRDGLLYTAADDEDPDAPGIQLTVRVDVDDAAIEHVHLRMPQEGTELADVVTEDLAGRRAAFFDVTLGVGAEHPVEAAVPTMPDVHARAVLVAAAE